MADEDDFCLEPEPEEDEEYIQYDIATYPSDFTLNGIQELWNKKDLIIPDFQREFVWNIKQSSLLVESFLMGLPVPPVFFYIDENNKSSMANKGYLAWFSFSRVILDLNLVKESDKYFA
jgi:hypothetical protein